LFTHKDSHLSPYWLNDASWANTNKRSDTSGKKAETGEIFEHIRGPYKYILINVDRIVYVISK